jgi:hypothetical protein
MARTHTSPHSTGPAILALVIAVAVIAALTLATHRAEPAAHGDDLGDLIRAFVHQGLPEHPLPPPRPQVAGRADAAG